MAEIVLERHTRCPTGRIEDETFFEIVLQDDSPLPGSDKTPRTTNIVRLFSRGTMQRNSSRDVLLTTGARRQREIVHAAKASPGEHFDVDISGLGLTVEWHQTEGRAFTASFDLYTGPAKPRPPRPGDRMDDYKAR